jgi:hypothetical protein
MKKFGQWQNILLTCKAPCPGSAFTAEPLLVKNIAIDFAGLTGVP